MKIQIKLLLPLCFFIVFQSCKQEKKTANIVQPSQEEQKDKPQIVENTTDQNEFPKIGHKVLDFVPKNNEYNIQYETSGDLNNDGLIDMVIVLEHKNDKTADRPILVLLQQKDKSYILDKKSDSVMPTMYTDDDYKMIESETIGIDKGVLIVNSYGSGGPNGNIFCHFNYLGNDLRLTYIETYDVGAGSWQSLYYDLEKGELEQEITNTMEEEMPTKSKTFKLKKVNYLFENASPSDIIRDAYKKIDSDW